jgi:hypothetical protein
MSESSEKCEDDDDDNNSTSNASNRRTCSLGRYDCRDGQVIL